MASLGGHPYYHPYRLPRRFTSRCGDDSRTKPGVWEVRAFTGRSPHGSPTQVSRTVRGTKKEALRVAAELTVAPAGRAAGRSVSDVLEAWARTHDATWAPASRGDQLSRVARINGDRIARLSVARLTIEDVERWHARLRDGGLADVSIRNVHGVLRAALTQAVRWGWVSRNVASLAELSSRKVSPRKVMSAADVRRVIAAGDAIRAEVGLMLRIAAVTGARRAELGRCAHHSARLDSTNRGTETSTAITDAVRPTCDGSMR